MRLPSNLHAYTLHGDTNGFTEIVISDNPCCSAFISVAFSSDVTTNKGLRTCGTVDNPTKVSYRWRVYLFKLGLCLMQDLVKV